MSSESTYSVFRCNDNLVVFHQHGHGTPQTLIVFREPKRMALHDKKLIAVYPYSHEAEILLDDPGHDSAQVLNAIALQLRADSKAALKRRLKGLACAVFGALITSAVWYQASGDKVYAGQSVSYSEPGIPPVQRPDSPVRSVTPADITGIALEKAPPETLTGIALDKAQPKTLTGSVFSQVDTAESQRMQDILQSSRSTLPASPSEVLQPSAPVAVTPAPIVTPEATPAAEQTETRAQPTRQLMADVLKRNADRGMFTISLSTGHARTLYAFLDPTCAVCRSMEPAIEQLAQQYNVVIFPVSVVNDGGDAVEKVVPLLCEKDPTLRAVGWSALFHADAGMAVPGQKESLPVDAECAAHAAAVVAVNDTGFRRFGFAGTPTVLTDTGIRLATGMLADPDMIDRFLKITDPMTPVQVDRFVSSLSVQE